MRFSVAPGETVLRAAERQGVPIRYGCRHGNCSTCKYRLLDGEVDFGAASPYSLSEGEREEGWALLCCAQPLGDLVVEDSQADDSRRLPVITPEQFSAVVTAVDALNPTLYRLQVRLCGEMSFYPGQFVELATPGHADRWRSYSIASPPSRPDELDFIVKRIPGGTFSEGVPGLQRNARLQVRGPFGQCYLRSGERPVLLVSVGSGIGPQFSMLRHAAAAGDPRPFTLVHGARTEEDLVLRDELQSLQEQLSLDLIDVLSRPAAAATWAGRVGRVTAVVHREVADASGLDAYLCGMPEMCDAVERLLEAKGIADGGVFADRFFATREQDTGLDVDIVSMRSAS